MNKLIAKSAALVAMSFAPLFSFADTFTANPIQFDPDGAGGNPTVTIDAFDWFVGSALVTRPPAGGANPIPQAPNTLNRPVQTYVHGVMTRYGLNGNPLDAPAGLNTTFELTYIAGFGEKVSTNADGSIATFLWDGSAGQENFFQIYYDDGIVGNPASKADALSGLGHKGGRLILSGVITATLTGTFTVAAGGVPLFDQLGPDNWGGTQTVVGNGSQTMIVLVQSADPAFFKSGIGPGSLLNFTAEQKLPFQQSNPSMNFETTGATVVSFGTLGGVNGVVGPNLELQVDPSNSFQTVAEDLACRVTGGGNDTSGLNAVTGAYDSTKAAGRTLVSVKPKGKLSETVTPYYSYTFGGQAGANTALQPQPKGQWEHNNHSSEFGLQFAFHGGKNAPAGTQIDEIRCTDPGWCKPARPAPNKQIDFTGWGTFSNISNNNQFDNQVTFTGIQNVIPEPKGQRPNEPVPTYHWFQVHIEDLGEGGSENPNVPAPGAICPTGGSGNNPFGSPAITSNVADCGCADFYRLTIYKGQQPELDANGKVMLDAKGDPVFAGGANKTDKIYVTPGYINGGNFQIHPLTGFDMK